MGNFNVINPEQGLPEELFLEISGLVPIPNVDLFILDDNGRLLLTWRDDIYFGKGWHLPGGCVRFKESMVDRVKKTAIMELNTSVSVDLEPITVKDVIISGVRDKLQNQNTRAHHIAVLYRCYIMDYETIKPLEEKGEAKWFSKIPSDILSVHDVYTDTFKKYGLL